MMLNLYYTCFKVPVQVNVEHKNNVVCAKYALVAPLHCIKRYVTETGWPVKSEHV